MVSCAVCPSTQRRGDAPAAFWNCFESARPKIWKHIETQSMRRSLSLSLSSPLLSFPKHNSCRCHLGRDLVFETLLARSSASLHPLYFPSTISFFVFACKRQNWKEIKPGKCVCVCPRQALFSLLSLLRVPFLCHLPVPSQQALSPRAMLGAGSIMTLNFRDQQTFGIGLGESRRLHDSLISLS